jgi:hypothetical protein
MCRHNAASHFYCENHVPYLTRPAAARQTISEITSLVVTSFKDSPLAFVDRAGPIGLQIPDQDIRRALLEAFGSVAGFASSGGPEVVQVESFESVVAAGAAAENLSPEVRRRVSTRLRHQEA